MALPVLLVLGAREERRYGGGAILRAGRLLSPASSWLSTWCSKSTQSWM
jgi:hypothetical protein